MIVEGRDKFITAQHEARRAVAYEQAQLIHFAMWDAKKMPKYKALKSASEISPEAQVDLVRAFLMAKVANV